MDYIHEYTNLTPQERRQLNYKEQYKQEVPDWDDSMIALRDAVAARLPANAKVLDLGCGHGNFVIDELQNRLSETIGIDLNEQTTAGNKSCNKIVYSDINNLPFSDATFDAVVSLWVLEHLSMPDQVFHEISRVLKPGGFFAFVTPNRKCFLIMIRRLMSQRVANRLLNIFYGRDVEDAFSVYYRANTPDDLQHLLTNAKLNIELIKINTDPSYTSFGPVSYLISKFLSSFPVSSFKPHIVAIARKEK